MSSHKDHGFFLTAAEYVITTGAVGLAFAALFAVCHCVRGAIAGGLSRMSGADETPFEFHAPSTKTAFWMGVAFETMRLGSGRSELVSLIN